MIFNFIIYIFCEYINLFFVKAFIFLIVIIYQSKLLLFHLCHIFQVRTRCYAIDFR